MTTATVSKSSQIRSALSNNESNKSKWAIAKEFQVPASMVYTIAKRLANPIISKHSFELDGVTFNSMSDAVRDFAKKNPEMTRYAIAKKFGVEYSFVFGAMKRNSKVPVDMIVPTTSTSKAPKAKRSKKSTKKS